MLGFLRVSDWWALTGSNRRPSRCKRDNSLGNATFPLIDGRTERDSMANKPQSAGHLLSTSGADGFVYFIAAASGPIKIGFAVNPKARLSTMQAGNADDLYLVATVIGDLTVEADYHKRFAEHRLRGEWFSPHPSILAEIDHITDDGKW